MIKRFSSAKKVIRLSIYVVGFLMVYFVFMSAIFPHEPVDFGRENVLDLVYSETVPISFDNDDGRYVGQVIDYKIKKGYKSFGSLEPVANDDVCLFTQLSVDRLDAFIELAASWNAYISVALYIENDGEMDYMYVTRTDY